VLAREVRRGGGYFEGKDLPEWCLDLLCIQYRTRNVRLSRHKFEFHVHFLMMSVVVDRPRHKEPRSAGRGWVVLPKDRRACLCRVCPRPDRMAHSRGSDIS